MLKITIELERPKHSYDILFEPGLGSDWQSEVEERVRADKYLVLLDAHLAKKWNAPPSRSTAEKWSFLWVRPGEENKNLDQYQELCEAALLLGVDRGTVLVAIGGGVTGDIAGFLAATLLRGVRLVQIPTSLLAQVDSSVGGKNGVNTLSGKNMIGTFHQPDLVMIDPGFLDSLPKREYRAGLAEIVKTAVLDGPAFFSELRRGTDLILSMNHGFISGIIAKCCRVKTRYVTLDEHDVGNRQLLNLGHTFGHVLESLAGFDGRVVHGEAVSVGLTLACRFSLSHGNMPAPEVEEVRELLAALELPVSIDQLGRDAAAPLDWEELLGGEEAVMMLLSDKKADAISVNLVLPQAIGDCRLEKGVDVQEVVEFMRRHRD